MPDVTYNVMRLQTCTSRIWLPTSKRLTGLRTQAEHRAEDRRGRDVESPDDPVAATFVVADAWRPAPGARARRREDPDPVEVVVSLNEDDDPLPGGAPSPPSMSRATARNPTGEGGAEKLYAASTSPCGPSPTPALPDR